MLDSMVFFFNRWGQWQKEICFRHINYELLIRHQVEISKTQMVLELGMVGNRSLGILGGMKSQGKGCYRWQVAACLYTDGNNPGEREKKNGKHRT